MEKDIQLLEKIYSGTHIGSRSLNTILPRVENESLRKCIIKQMNEYDKINSEAKSQINSMGVKVKKDSLAVLGAVIESKINTAINPSSSHVAEMIVKGSNMGVLNLTKEMNRSLFSSPEVYSLGRKLLDTEEQNLSRMKQFL